MFEPKIYKKNGLEAFRLAGSDGSEFFYEGAIDCDEKVLYKDSLGRMYYPVVTAIGGDVKYYVELDPQVPQISSVGKDARDKSISRLVNASPRPDASLPVDIFVKPEPVQEILPEEPAEVPQAPIAPENAAPVVEPVPDEKSPEPIAEVPAPAPTEHVKSAEAASAIHAVFSPKVDILHPPIAQTGETVATEPGKEPEKPEKPSPAKPPAKASKRRSLKWPLVIAVIVIVLLAASAVGVYIVKPGAYDGLRSMLNGASPTPVPTATPTATPSPSPTPAPDIGTPSTDIVKLIDSASPEIAAFAQAHVNETSANDSLRQTCDLFDYVNSQWKYTDSYATPRNASEIAATLDGASRDYTVLMTALMQSQGVICRVVFSYPGESDLPSYYPEVLVANTSAGYQLVVQQLNLWYGISSPQGHKDDIGYWVALSTGSSPGIRPLDAMKEFALYDMTIRSL